mmetsp:Transcript_106618/g.331122  ORF Transcript_106618/g.331122 Transcript_106618/m.331122 type:complete len:261 (-) Transcript_106618:104-886(-)
MAGSRSLKSFNVNDFASKLNEAKASFYSDGSSPAASLKAPAEGESASEGKPATSWLSKLGGALPGLSSAADLGGIAGVAAATQKGMQGVAAMTGRAKTMAKSAGTTISENAISRQRWTSFFGGVLMGSCLISLAFAFLPMVVFAPQKFALLFTLGSLSVMSSFSILRGHAAFVRHLLSRSRALFSAVYVSSMTGTLWASLIYRSYLLTMLFAAVQVTALAWFLVSYIPGGRRALGFATGIAWRITRTCCRCASKGSILPF